MKLHIATSCARAKTMHSHVLFKMLAMLFFVFMSATAFAQQSVPVTGGGTLSFQVTQTQNWCGAGQIFYARQFNYSNFVYTNTSGTYPLTGSATSIEVTGDNQGNCPPPPPPTPVSMSTSTITVTFTPTNSGSGTAVAGPISSQGLLYPKYVVAGVVYAPPGSSSYVSYASASTVGNTTSISNSYSNDVGHKISLSLKFGSMTLGVGATVQVTATQSNDYTVGSNNSTTATLTKMTGTTWKAPGTPTMSPLTHDDDYIYLWLNPVMAMTLTPAFGSNPASAVWSGYGFDPSDPASGEPVAGTAYNGGPDVVPVLVGCLNGHFSCPSTLTWLGNAETSSSYVVSGQLARSWQSASSGYTWPSGEEAGLSFNDICQILSFDPLAQTPSGCPTPNNYTELNGIPDITADGRYSLAPYPPNDIAYAVGGINQMYNVVQTNTQSASTGNSTQTKTAFSLSDQVSVGFTSDLSATLIDSTTQTLISNYSSLNTITSTTTLTDALSVTGPPASTPPYTGPVEFVAYQDNTFGTYVFVPVN